MPLNLDDPGFISALNASAESAEVGSFFSGSTTNGSEGSWIGYRGSATYSYQWNCLILLGHNDSTFKIVRGIRSGQSSSWSFYLINH